MYKLVATWSAPRAADVPEFERYYADVHAPLASVVPGLRRIRLTRTSDGLEGGTPGFYRVAEMLFERPEDVEKSAHSEEWSAMRADAGKMIERFGVSLTVAMGWEDDRAAGAKEQTR